MNSEFEIQKQVQEALYDELAIRAETLTRIKNTIAKKLGISTVGPMGLIPDDIKFNPRYVAANALYNQAFQAIRNFNGPFVKKFKKELAAEREAKYTALAKTVWEEQQK